MFLLFYLLPEGYLEQLGLSKAENRLKLFPFAKPEKSQEKKKVLLEPFLSRKKMKKSSQKTKQRKTSQEKKE